MLDKNLREEYDIYIKAGFGQQQISEIQKIELERAFMAGAWVMLCAMEEVSSPEISEEAAIDYFAARHTECKEFVEKMLHDKDR